LRLISCPHLDLPRLPVNASAHRSLHEDLTLHRLPTCQR
jgi:hypothetical protein